MAGDLFDFEENFLDDDWCEQEDIDQLYFDFGGLFPSLFSSF